ncbi:Hpt domain-containing protein [Rhodopseudomonas sp. B29]|uniref:Hpt domain-containing protein n=1 Tax=Rhodopseudomonas sp. B29 TaxID=95607 RepID=UPI00034DADFA|nr:Hpt domain-containing protein [Rhodopseudomonas sp. B29]
MANKRSDLIVETHADHQVITQPNPLRAAVRRVETSEGDDPIGRAEAALAGLAGEFSSWMHEECDRLISAHAGLRNNGVTKAARDELFHAAHDIKGDAVTFGFPAAALAAESLCRVIEHAPDLARVPDELIANHVAAIQAIVREGERSNPAVEKKLVKKLRSVADDYLTSVNRDRPEHLEAILAPPLAPRE